MSEFEVEFREETQDGFEEGSPPDGFTSRLMQRLDLRLRERRRRRMRQSAAAAVLLCIGAGGLTAVHEREQRLEAQRARKQFALAIEITARSLDPAERALAKIDKTHAASKGLIQGEL